MRNYGALDAIERHELLPIIDGPDVDPDPEWHPIKYLSDSSETKSPNSSTAASLYTLTEESELLIEPSREPEKPWNLCAPFDSFFVLLGFENNPINSSMPSGERNSSAADLRLSMLSNFSTAYNILNISLVLQIMETLYPLSAEEKSFCSATLIAGMIVGQVGAGILGDVLGRHRAMTIVMFLQVSASIVSAFSQNIVLEGHSISIYQVLGAVRFVLGLGAGGVYPLAATLTAETVQSDMERAKSTTIAFSSQGLGYLAVYVVACLVVMLFGPSDFAWRLLLGLGALPGIVLTVIRAQRSSTSSRAAIQSDSKLPQTSAIRVVPLSIYDAVSMESDIGRKMLGTGGCWLLFDILFYGNAMFEPLVLSATFGASETIPQVAIDSTTLALLSLPGYFFSVYAVGKLSPRFIQIQGFMMMGLLYLVIAVFFRAFVGNPLSLFVYGLTFFFSNYGPNCTTYILPSLTFSRPCRSTLNGICAACGKVGALIGTALFATASELYGQQTVFVACALMSFLGCIVTWACVSEDVGTSAAHRRDSSPDLATISDEEYLETEQQKSTVPVRLFYSQPSLFDLNK